VILTFNFVAQKTRRCEVMLKTSLVEIPDKEIRLFVCIRDGCGDRPCFVEYVMGLLSKRPMRPEHDAG
jgi:hypothetical protein